MAVDSFFIHSCCTHNAGENIKVDYFGQTCVQVNKYFYISSKGVEYDNEFFRWTSFQIFAQYHIGMKWKHVEWQFQEFRIVW